MAREGGATSTSSQAIGISRSGVEADLCAPDRVRALHFAKFCTTLHPFPGASHVPSGIFANTLSVCMAEKHLRNVTCQIGHRSLHTPIRRTSASQLLVQC